VSGNPTGAGDAVTAALAAGLAANSSWPDALRDAVATSAAAVTMPAAGEVDLALRAELLALVRVRAGSGTAPHR
jgi:tagatose 6-phosphate kinase